MIVNKMSVKHEISDEYKTLYWRNRFKFEIWSEGLNESQMNESGVIKVNSIETLRQYLNKIRNNYIRDIKNTKYDKSVYKTDISVILDYTSTKIIIRIDINDTNYEYFSVQDVSDIIKGFLDRLKEYVDYQV